MAEKICYILYVGTNVGMNVVGVYENRRQAERDKREKMNAHPNSWYFVGEAPFFDYPRNSSD